MHSKSLRHIADKCYGYGTHDVYNTNIDVQSSKYGFISRGVICQQDIVWRRTYIVFKTEKYNMCIEIDT